MNLPNGISLLRLPLALLFVLLDSTAARALVLLVAAFTDWIDGRLARRTGRVSTTGEWLDPLADKTFMVSALVVLVIERGVPSWTLPLLLLRDIGVLVGAIALMAMGTRRRSPARRLGKAVTWLQFLAIGVILLRPEWAMWVAPLIALAGAAALVDYARVLSRG